MAPFSAFSPGAERPPLLEGKNMVHYKYATVEEVRNHLAHVTNHVQDEWARGELLDLCEALDKLVEYVAVRQIPCLNLYEE